MGLLIVSTLFVGHVFSSGNEHRGEIRSVAFPLLSRAHGVAPRVQVYAAAPTITSITPDTLEPGGEATILGTGFHNQPGYNTVLVDGVPVHVKSASPTQLVIELPAGGFQCRQDRIVTVEVRVNRAPARADHPLRVAQYLELQQGQVVTSDEFGLGTCVELAQTGGRYLIGVVNAEHDDVSRGFMLQGREGRAAAPPILPSATDTGLVKLSSEKRAADASAARAGPAGTDGPAHVELLADERNRVRERRARGRMPPPRLAGVPAVPRPPPRVGDVDTMRMWKKWDDCSDHVDIAARAVYVGDHAIIYEDVAAPLARTMDDDFRHLGEEFDSVMWEIVTRTFGDPLALDSALDADGRVRMLFTPHVDTLNADVFGYVTTCDFYARDVGNQSSNEGEVFYAKVPPTTERRAAWLREVRPTAIHEVKHLASYAERLSRDGYPEYAWLEEGTAMIAEELYGRTFSGAGQGDNVGFVPGLACQYSWDVACAGVPYALGLSFETLYDYLYEPETWSPLKPGRKTYGAGWSLVRWAADLSQTSEAEFFSGITQNIFAHGAENLAQFTGRPFSELIVDWHVATALDDADGYIPSRPEHAMRSWNTRDVYRNLNQVDSGYYPREFPLQPRYRAFGPFVVQVSELPSASASFIEITGVQSATQLLGLRNADGSGLKDSTVRMFIARLQ